MTIQNDIDNFGPTCNAAKLIRLAAETNANTANRTISVPTVNDLPDLIDQTVDPGTVFYVESIRVPVIAQIGCWSGLDNRELRNDYIVGLSWAWGRNISEQLGDGTNATRSSPVSVVGGFTDWCQASVGSNHSLAVRQNGTLWAWGSGGQGGLGDNTTVPKSSPVSVVGGFTDWCQASAGIGHSLGVRQNGTLWAWGNNVFSQCGSLGDNTTVPKSSPVSVVGGFTDWCQASAGNYHSLGVRSNGSLWAWGNNVCGRLGDETITNKSSPVSVVGGFNDWLQASAGYCHSLAVRQNGTLWAWGNNLCGRLGDGTTVAKSSPVSVVGGFTDWCQASAGGGHSLGLRSNGTLWAWGCAGQGRLGDGTCFTKTSPVSVVGGFTDWIQASAGNRHSVGLRSNGSIWAWGYNTQGALGDNSTIDRCSPVSVVGGFSDWCAIGQLDGTAVSSFGIRSIP